MRYFRQHNKNPKPIKWRYDELPRDHGAKSGPRGRGERRLPPCSGRLAVAPVSRAHGARNNILQNPGTVLRKPTPNVRLHNVVPAGRPPSSPFSRCREQFYAQKFCRTLFLRPTFCVILFLSRRIGQSVPSPLQLAKPRTAAVRAPRAPSCDHGPIRGTPTEPARRPPRAFPRRSLAWPRGPGTNICKIREQFYANRRPARSRERRKRYYLT